MSFPNLKLTKSFLISKLTIRSTKFYLSVFKKTLIEYLSDVTMEIYTSVSKRTIESNEFSKIIYIIVK